MRACVVLVAYRKPPDVRFPDTLALLRRVPWLQGVPREVLQQLLAGGLGGEIVER